MFKSKFIPKLATNETSKGGSSSNERAKRIKTLPSEKVDRFTNKDEGLMT